MLASWLPRRTAAAPVFGSAQGFAVRLGPRAMCLGLACEDLGHSVAKSRGLSLGVQREDSGAIVLGFRIGFYGFRVCYIRLTSFKRKL